MKIGIFDPLFAQQPIEEMLDFVAEAGCTAVEIGTGRYPGTPHIDVDGLLEDDGKVRDYKALFSSRGLEISALSCHGNPLHPNKEQARQSDSIYRKSGRAGAEVGTADGRLLLRLPRRLRGLQISELGDLPLAAGLPRNPRLAVEYRRHPLLARGGRVRRAAQHPRRLRDAPRLHLLQPRDDAQDERRRRPRDRREC